tara:strand:+ start:410 stop:1756 length:1347 start_codon:yes stop_codon:yes gene_type:complete
MAALPKEVQYNKPMASLPSDTRMSQTIVRPSNGATFAGDGNIIQFDLPAHSFLVPNSLCLNLNITITPADNTQVIEVRGVPAASWISRVETIVGGSLLEAVSDYGRLYNMISQAKLSADEKNSLYTEFGYGGGGVDGLDENNPTFHNLNGRLGPQSTGTNAAAGTFPVSLPLGCLLSSCSELVPLGHMGGVRIQITTAQIAEYIRVSSGTADMPTMSFTDLEMTFDLVDFGAGMDSVVRSMAVDGDLVLKSQGWNVTNVNFPDLAGATDATYIYNVRLSSIKSLVLQLTGEAGADALNAGYDAVKAGGQTGSVQFFLANRPFPPTPLRETNTAAIKSALRQAFGDAHDVYSARNSITQKMWSENAELLGADAEASSITVPAAHYYGMNTEKLSSNSVMLSGESSQLTPINVRVSTSSATAAAATLTLYSCYDALIALNVNTRQVAVRV